MLEYSSVGRASALQAEGHRFKSCNAHINRKRGYLVAGSGFCLACDVCAVEDSTDDCKKPNKKIYSLESLGVNLTALTEQCFGFDLEWSANDHTSDFVCSLGAVFFYKFGEID